MAFSCFKCPECLFYSKREDFFKNHAVTCHPSSVKLFQKIQENSVFLPQLSTKDLLERSNAVSKESNDHTDPINVKNETIAEDTRNLNMNIDYRNKIRRIDIERNKKEGYNSESLTKVEDYRLMSVGLWN